MNSSQHQKKQSLEIWWLFSTINEKAKTILNMVKWTKSLLHAESFPMLYAYWVIPPITYFTSAIYPMSYYYRWQSDIRHIIPLIDVPRRLCTISNRNSWETRVSKNNEIKMKQNTQKAYQVLPFLQQEQPTGSEIYTSRNY